MIATSSPSFGPQPSWRGKAVPGSGERRAAGRRGRCGIVGHVMPGQDEPKDFAPVTEEEQEVLLRVIEVLRKLSYGTILLVVQDGRVVQIETAEKIRLR
jgi:hypothetical protein